MSDKKNFNFFLVDDDPFYLNLLEQMLRNQGHDQMHLFESGVDCLNALNQKPDIIFLDHNMDTINGYEVLKKIKRFDPDIFVVMVSGQEDLKTAVDSLKHGAFDYILKSGDEGQKISEVIEKIGQVLDIQERSKPSLLKSIFSLF